MDMYKIVRKYQNDHPDELVEDHLILEEVQLHCSHHNSSSRSCVTLEGLKRTEEKGPWFDAYYLMD